MKRAAVAICIALQMSPAMSSSSLLNDCSSAIEFMERRQTQNDIGAANCIGFVRGVTEAHRTLTRTVSLTPVYCEPPNVDVEQRIRIVAGWLKNNPSELHFSSSSLVLTALHEAFPCPTK